MLKKLASKLASNQEFLKVLNMVGKLANKINVSEKDGMKIVVINFTIDELAKELGERAVIVLPEDLPKHLKKTKDGRLALVV